METSILKALPPLGELETKPVLKSLAAAHRAIAELKGVSRIIFNQSIINNMLVLQEALASSAIENIYISRDEMYKSELFSNEINSTAAKDVQNYAAALHEGFAAVKQDELLTSRHILAVQELLQGNNAGFRKLPGTDLKNSLTGESVYVPPQNNAKIMQLMSNLELYINDDTLSSVDQLVKLAVIHFQFESIHPFYDDNGRTGRIINNLYLVLKGLLISPILSLSRYILQTKPDYYRLLQSIHINENWEEWILYILKGVEVTARQTILVILKTKELMQQYKINIQEQFRFYSHELLNKLFLHPYLKPELLEDDLKISKLTAAKYLDQLVVAGMLEKKKLGRVSYYVNQALFNVLSNSQV